jgi:uncharacterized protein (DUF1684 family)
MKYVFHTAYFLIVFSLISACNNSAKENNASESEIQSETEHTEALKEPVIPVFSTYKAAIEAMRSDKDMSMKSGETIEPEKRNEFKGLKYFEPDSTYIFKATMELLKPEKVLFKTTDTRTPEYYKFCKLNFTRDGSKLTLYGYVDDPESPKRIFVPFKDLTGNKETYGGGRYIDLHYNGERTMILLDFNSAYNPYCHYNHNYSCPLVPAENILDIPIKAGEKKLYE